MSTIIFEKFFDKVGFIKTTLFCLFVVILFSKTTLKIKFEKSLLINVKVIIAREKKTIYKIVNQKSSSKKEIANKSRKYTLLASSKRVVTSTGDDH